jgi:hypothetical protein
LRDNASDVAASNKAFGYMLGSFGRIGTPPLHLRIVQSNRLPLL